MAALLLAGLSACASSVRLYEGARRPRDEVAILTDSGCRKVALVVIDDHNRVDSDKVPSAYSSYTAEILPGSHSVTVKWVSAWREEFAGAAGAAAVTLSATYELLRVLGGGSPGGSTATGKRWVPAAVASIRFSFHASAAHRYRIRESKGPDRQASNAIRGCWQYLGLVTVDDEESTELWLVDETALRAAGGA